MYSCSWSALKQISRQWAFPGKHWTCTLIKMPTSPWQLLASIGSTGEVLWLVVEKKLCRWKKWKSGKSGKCNCLMLALTWIFLTASSEAALTNWLEHLERKAVFSVNCRSSLSLISLMFPWEHCAYLFYIVEGRLWIQKVTFHPRSKLSFKTMS